jgi:hypothetical protein
VLDGDDPGFVYQSSGTADHMEWTIYSLEAPRNGTDRGISAIKICWRNFWQKMKWQG